MADKEVKFTKDEMSQLTELQQTYAAVQNTLGQLSVSRIRFAVAASPNEKRVKLIGEVVSSVHLTPRVSASLSASGAGVLKSASTEEFGSRNTMSLSPRESGGLSVRTSSDGVAVGTSTGVAVGTGTFVRTGVFVGTEVAVVTEAIFGSVAGVGATSLTITRGVGVG